MTCQKESDCVHGVGCFLKDEWDVARCSAFKRKPQEMTNEAWLKSLPTEKLADKLTDFSFWLVPTLPSDERREHIREKMMEWLKEKCE